MSGPFVSRWAALLVYVSLTLTGLVTMLPSLYLAWRLFKWLVHKALET